MTSAAVPDQETFDRFQSNQQSLSQQAFHVTISPDGIAEMVFDLPGEKVNKFSLPVLHELENHIDRLAKNPSIKALKFISGKDDFIAGADLHSFENAFKDPAVAESILQEGHRVFSKIQKLPFPTIAVINGVCLGGGLECALSFTYRVVSDHPKTMLGLPEVSLGIFPGWGGTQRLPRLIGLTEGLNMILAGKIIPAVKAFKIHLADAIVPWEFLKAKSDEFIRIILIPEGKKKVLERRNKRSFVTKLLEDTPPGRALIFRQSKKAVLERTKGRYPAPLAALEVIKNSCQLPLDEGLKVEIDFFTKCIKDNTLKLSTYLIPLFFIQEHAKKETGIAKEVKPAEVRSTAVIGAGTMGATIAWLLADHNIPARMKDISWELAGKGIGVARALFEKGVKVRKITPSELSRRFHLLTGTVDYSGFQRCDLAIEAATENLELKRKIFQELEAALPEKAVIASNTSSLTIADMCKEMKHPERFVGMHFFNPVPKMPLVEVVAGEHSTQEALATVVDVCKKLGKTPIIVKDCPGFLVNRIFMLGANEVLLLLEAGYSMDSIKKELDDFGMPMDPFLLADEVGNDISYKVAKTLNEAYGERMIPAKLMQLMAEKGFLGHKVGKGFYLYDGKNTKVNPEVSNLLNTINNRQANLPEDEIKPRFLYSMINEAARCLEEKIVNRADFLDLSLIMGIGFPPHRGGLLRYADEVGIENVVATLKQLEKAYGVRFKPCNLLEQMATNHQKFY